MWVAPGTAAASRKPPVLSAVAAVVVVLLGSTAFDGLSRTVFWQNGPGAGNDPVSGTLGMLAMIALVIGMGAGSSVLIGQAWGAGEVDKVKAVAGTALTVTTFVGVLIAIFGSRTRAEWMELSVERHLGMCPVNSAADLVTDPHAAQRHTVRTQDHPLGGREFGEERLHPASALLGVRSRQSGP